MAKLPKYPKIKINQIPDGAILLFYGGNELTETVGYLVYRHKYNPPAFHAALYLEKGMFVNVGKTVTLNMIKDEFRSTRRIDVIVYNFLSPEQKEMIMETGKKDIGKIYDIKGFLGFGRKLPLIGKLFPKGSKKLPFCSDHVQDAYRAANVLVAETSDEETAPWHLLEYAEAHPGIADIYTIHTGKQFRT